MLEAATERSVIDERTIELIAQRVIAAIRDDLDAFAAELSISRQASEQLTVGQLAVRLGVARSTVYAHWREWGGYKLGTGDKAPIRFDSMPLSVANTPSLSRVLADLGASGVTEPEPASAPKRSRSRPRRRDLITDTPRLVHPAELVEV